MKRCSAGTFLFVLGCILVAAADCQYIEATLRMPDSLAGPREPWSILYNPVDNTVFVSGAGDGVAVVDAATQRKLAGIPLPVNTWALCFDGRDDKVYCGAQDSGLVFVIDGATNTLVTTIEVPGVPTRLCYNPAANKVYCALDRVGGREAKAEVRSQNSELRMQNSGAASRKLIAVGGSRAGARALREPVDYVVRSGPDLFKYAVPADSFGSIAIVDCSTDSVIAEIQASNRPVELCCNPAANKVYCGLEPSGELLVIDGAGDSLLGTVRLSVLDYGRIGYNPAGDRLYCLDCGFGEVAVVDAGPDSLVRWLRVGEEPLDVCVNPVLNKVYVANGASGEIDVLSGAGDSTLSYLSPGGDLVALVYDSVDNRVYCSDLDGDRLVGVDCSNDSLLDGIELGCSPGPLEYNPVQNVVYALSTSDNGLCAVDPESGRVLAQLAFRFTPLTLCYGTGGDKLYCAGSEGLVAVFDGNTHAPVATVAVDVEPYLLLYAAHENKVYCAGENGESRLYVIDGVGDSVLAELPVDYYPAALCYEPVARKAYCACAEDYTLAVVDARGDSIIATLEVGDFPVALTANWLDSKVYCSNRYDGTVTIIDGAQNVVLRAVEVGYPAAGLCFVPFDDKVYCTSERDMLVLIDGVTNRVVDSIFVAFYVDDVVYTSLTNRVYAIDRSAGIIAAVDCATRQLVASLSVGAGVTAVAHDSIADKMYCVRRDRDSVTVLDCRTLHTMGIGVGDAPRAIAWNPSHRRMYVANYEDATISVIRDSSIVGVAEGQGPGPERQGPMATVVRGSLLLPRSASAQVPSDGTTLEPSTPWTLFSVSGRKAMELVPGANDVRHLAPGVYFVRSGPSAVHKVVVTR